MEKIVKCPYCGREIKVEVFTKMVHQGRSEYPITDVRLSKVKKHS